MCSLYVLQNGFVARHIFYFGWGYVPHSAGMLTALYREPICDQGNGPERRGK